MNWVGHQQRSNGRTANDEHLGGLHQYLDVPLLHQESADHCSKDQNDA
jgi:hypothetical protein